MDEPCFVEKAQPVQQLLREDTHQSRAQTPELILLDELVQIHAKKFEHQTKMLPMNEGIF